MALLGNPASTAEQTRIKAVLGNILVQTVEMQAARVAGTSTHKSQRKKGQQGLPARLLRQLKSFQQRYTQMVTSGPSPEAVHEFLNALYADRQLFWIVNLAMLQVSQSHLTLFRKREHQQAVFDALDPAFEFAGKQLRASVRPGATDPAYEQMVRALAALYLAVTGTFPGRSSDAMQDGLEQGRFLALCRLMAAAVNDALPDEYRRRTPSDLVKTVRRMVKELKAERGTAEAP